MEMRDLVKLARENVDGFAGIQYGLIVENEVGDILQVNHVLEAKPYNVLGGWCEVHVNGWKVPYRHISVGTLEEGCILEAVWGALEDLGALDVQVDDNDEKAPQIGSQGLTGASDTLQSDEPVTDEQKTELNNLITEVAMARNVSFGTAKGALMKSSAAANAGVSRGDDLTFSWQAEMLIGQLRRWLEVSRG